MKKHICILLMVIWTLSGFLSGCKEKSAGPYPTPLPIQSTPSTSIDSSRDSSPEALNACPINQQALAMRTDQIPDWNHLGLFACYNLTLNLVDPENPFPASEILVMTNLDTDPLHEVVFRIFPNAKNIYGGKLTVFEVVANHKSLQTEVFLDDRSALRVLLDKPLLPKETITLKLSFTLELPVTTASPESYGIFGKSASEPIFTMANWFPILAPRENGKWLASPVLRGGDAVTSDSALFRVSITTLPSWQVAATGKEILRSEDGGNIRREYVSGPVRDFMISASPDFLTRKLEVGEIIVTQFGLETTYAKWDQVLSITRSALDYFQKTFGPYPFNEIDIVAVPLQNASGVEYPGIILITTNAYLPSSRQGLLEVVTVHELAHQWWYSIIGNDVIANPWQDEGLTTYSTMDYFRAVSSPIYPVLLNDYRDRVNAYHKENPGESITQPVTAFQGRETAYSILVYAKAALFFDSIRTRMGQSNFDSALRQYYQTNRYRLVQPVVLTDAIQRNGQSNLSDLFIDYGINQFTP